MRRGGFIPFLAMLSCGSFGTTSTIVDASPLPGDAAPNNDAGDASSLVDGGSNVVFAENFDKNACGLFTDHNATLTEAPGRTGMGCKVCRTDADTYFNLHTRDPLPKAAGRYDIEVWIKLDSGAFVPEAGFLVDGTVTSQGGGAFSSSSFTAAKLTFIATANQVLEPAVFAGPVATTGTFCFIVDDLIVTKR